VADGREDLRGKRQGLSGDNREGFDKEDLRKGNY
jgi:hypothetical protein